MNGDNSEKIRQRMAAWNLFSRMTKDELDERLPAGAMLHPQGKHPVPMAFITSDKMVGMILYQAANIDGYVTLSVSEIARRTLLSDRTVRDALKKLIAARIIKINKSGNVLGTATGYKVRYK